MNFVTFTPSYDEQLLKRGQHLCLINNEAPEHSMEKKLYCIVKSVSREKLVITYMTQGGSMEDSVLTIEEAMDTYTIVNLVPDVNELKDDSNIKQFQKEDKFYAD